MHEPWQIRQRSRSAMCDFWHRLRVGVLGTVLIVLVVCGGRSLGL